MSIFLTKTFCLPDVMSFPQKSLYDTNATTEYCSICYTYRLCGHIPIVTCDNAKCTLIYHTNCLREWFSTLSDTKTFLNMVSGRCPSCKEVKHQINRTNCFFHLNSLLFSIFSCRNYQRHLMIC